MPSDLQDPRYLRAGWEIPSEGYCDQPYGVVNEDGSWTCVMTTGSGHEGQTGQHVVSTISRDRGRTWSELVDIEPADGPEASWAMPLKVPDTGRIYVFYTYNKDNLRTVRTISGEEISRVDSLGVYAYKYSDDNGQSWSAERWEIPMREFDVDRANAYGGKVQFFWGVGKPFAHEGAAYVMASKCGGFGPGFFTSNEGVLFRSTNLLTEPDPSKHRWETLPEGEVGLRTPEGGGPIAGEFNATPMNDGSLFGTFRTIDGYSCEAYSRDDGRSWAVDWMRYHPGSRAVKNPRAANFVRRFSNGNYLYWFDFHGGEVLGRACAQSPSLGYELRNPAWLMGGVERDGVIHWSQPEIILYDPSIGDRFSYPDFIEQDGTVYLTETQKTVARVHELDRSLLEAMWSTVDGSQPTEVREGLLAQSAETDSKLSLPELPILATRGASWVSAETGATLGDGNDIVPGSGLSISFHVYFDSLDPWQILFDSRDAEGKGMLVMLTDRGTLELTLSGRCYGEPGGRWSAGLTRSSWDCDPGLLRGGCEHHVVFIVDGGPKLVTVVVDGQLCDGGAERQVGWGRFHPDLRDVNGSSEAKLAPGLKGNLREVRVYGRALRTAEAVSMYRARKGNG